MKKQIQFISFSFAFIFSLSLAGQMIPAFESNMPVEASGWEFKTDNKLQTPVADVRGDVDPELAALLKYTLDSMRLQIDMVGVGAALRTPEGDIWADGSGISTDVGVTDPMTKDHRVAIGSVSKTFTAACILSLVDEGLLSLEDSLGMYLPTYDNITGEATIRNLLQHTSGIYNYTNNNAVWATISADPAAITQIWEPSEVLEGYILPPDFAPNGGWNYSNTGFVLLGEIIESVTGNKYYDEIKTRFLDPMGLETVYHPPHDTWQLPTAHLWRDNDGDGTLNDDNDLFQNWNSLYSVAGAAGAYFATPADMAEWISQLHAGNVISEQSTDEMQNALTLNASLGYGLGTMRRNFLGKTAYGHGGDIFYAASTYYFPFDQVGVSIQTNNSPTSSSDLDPVVRALLDAYLNFTPSTPTHNIFDEPIFEISPNPFENQVRIEYEIPRNSEVNVSILNTLGQEIEFFDLGEKSGNQSFIWDASNVVSGTYFVRFNIGGEDYLRKVIRL